MKKLFLLWLLALPALAQVYGPANRVAVPGAVNIPVKRTTIPAGATIITLKKGGTTTTVTIPTGALSLSATALTSAGVYNSTGVKVRSLWENVTTPPGSVTVGWDGTDDFGSAVATGSYSVSMVASNIQATWQGPIGNTSYTGPSSYSSLRQNYRFTQDILNPAGSNYLYQADQYPEAKSSVVRGLLTDIQKEQSVYTQKQGSSVIHLASDGTYLFAATYEMSQGQPPNFTGRSPKSGVRATVLATGAPYSFSTGNTTTYVPDNGESLTLTAFKDDSLQRITGLAVQPSGNYLFVPYARQNKIEVRNKFSGALAQTITTITGPKRMVCNSAGNLFVISGTTVLHYAINTDGTLGALTRTYSGFSEPLAVAVSKDNATLAVADGGTSQQVKAYTIATGAAAWTIGTAGGYRTDPNVSTAKLYLSDDTTIKETGLSFTADGSIWVIDAGNYRLLRYNSSQQYAEQLMWIPNNYSPWVDQNNPTRVFAQFLEFSVDYSKAETYTPGAWALTKNWRAMIPAAYFQRNNLLQNIQIEGSLRTVTTFSGNSNPALNNGRTYALTLIWGGGYAVVELPPSGQLRFTGQTFSGAVSLGKDGSIYTSEQGATNYVLSKRPLTGFDASNNPIWGSSATVVSVPTGANDPVNHFGGSTPYALADDGTVVVFDNNKIANGAGYGYHIGTIPAGASYFKTQNALATHLLYEGPYPLNGQYDIGNGVNYGGSTLISAAGNIAFWQYRGEAWKDAQTNFWHMIHIPTGLNVGMFGKSALYSNQTGDWAGNAGNVYYGVSTFGPDGNVYVYHGEESPWGGVHRWKVTGLNTTYVQSTTTTVVTTTNPKKISLYGKLGRIGATLVNGQNGVIRTGTDAGEFQFRSGVYKTVKGTDPYNPPDLYVRQSSAIGEQQVTIPFNTTLTGLSSWTISYTYEATQYFGNIGEYGDPTSEGGYTRILDNAGKILVQYGQRSISGGNVLTVNGVQIATGASAIQSFAPIVITSNGTNMTFKYGTHPAVTINKVDATAALGSPASFQHFMWVGANAGPKYGRIWDYSDGYFETN